MIISTGVANLKEIETAMNTAVKGGSKEVSLLYCVSNYPSKIDDFNFKNIEIMKKNFGCIVGFSDHSIDNRISFSAVLSGADIVEKHIALNNQIDGHDIKFSIKGDEILNFRKNIDIAWSLRGKNYFYRNKSELKSLIYRRSIYASKKIAKGEKFSRNNVKIVRPGFGLNPKYFLRLINKKSKNNYEFGSKIKKTEII